MTNLTDVQPGSDSGPAEVRETPEDFARLLRRRAEDAAAVSVHHASLSQQYLLLSQKFAALAEQSDRGSLAHASQMLSLLEQEASGGQPAPPIGLSLSASEAIIPGPSEPRGVSSISRWPTAQFHGQLTSTAVPATVGRPASDVSFAPAADGQSMAAVVADRRARSARGQSGSRRSKRVRDLAERLRLMAPLILDRVRVRARKADLRPRLRSSTEELKKSRGSLTCSIALISVVLVSMGMMRLEIEPEWEPTPIIASFSDKPEPVEEPLPIELPTPVPEVGKQQEMETPVPAEKPEEPPPPEPEPAPQPEMIAEMPVSEPVVEPLPENDSAPVVERTTEPVPSADSIAAMSNRTGEGRQLMLQKYGGSAASESAVGHALQWLASRQRRDGSWDFIDVGQCSQPGTVNNPIGATAYALLPFLAAGQTHKDKDSPYRRSVEAGLGYLLSASVATPAGLDLRGVLNKGDKDKEPNEAYYVHGAATLALCEAYAMTKDRRLKTAAEAAVQFLLNSQDPRGGGWRYLPQQPGSTSVTAVQVMALMTAKKAGIKVPDSSLAGAMHYLDSVQVDQHGRYGYEVEKKTYQASVTAMALLTRISLGWGRDDGDLREGVALLSKRGPYDNLYYNYFATQVMRNWGGEEWERWNDRLRDDLIRWQETEGDAKGSWAPRDRDDYSRAGGRLLSTILATLTLEVYYRYQPMLPEVIPSPSALVIPDDPDPAADPKPDKSPDQSASDRKKKTKDQRAESRPL